MSSAKQIFEYLPGIWRLSRQTLTSLMEWDRSGAECIKGNGFAAFVLNQKDANLLIYSEKVTVTVPADPNSAMNGMEAKQKYKYRFDSQASTLSKYFFDDRLFYALDLASANEASGSVYTASTACGEHLCEQDFYTAKYMFIDRDSFRLTYSVKGPKKCYEIQNEFKRCEDSDVQELGINIRDYEIV